MSGDSQKIKIFLGILGVLVTAGIVVVLSLYFSNTRLNNYQAKQDLSNEEVKGDLQSVKSGDLDEKSLTIDKLSDSVFLTGITSNGDITSAQVQEAVITGGSLDQNIFNVTYQDGTSAKVTIGEGKITDFHLKDGSVTTVKILDSAVTTAKLSDSSVTTVKILDGSVTSSKLADGTVITQTLADGSVTEAKLANGIQLSKWRSLW